MLCYHNLFSVLYGSNNKKPMMPRNVLIQSVVVYQDYNKGCKVKKNISCLDKKIIACDVPHRGNR
jgi:hypothetical protein